MFLTECSFNSIFKQISVGERGKNIENNVINWRNIQGALYQYSEFRVTLYFSVLAEGDVCRGYALWWDTLVV